MIHFVVAPGHGYTLRAILDPERQLRPLAAKAWRYSELFLQSELPSGTWIFTDLERLAVWELQLAGELARLIRQAGPHFRILNDPARAAARYELLVRLHEQQINGFRAWRAEDGIPPARYPVFLRTESDHHHPLTGLIHRPAGLAATLAEAEQRGIPKRGLLIVEYQAEPLEHGGYRKYGAYRFGDRIVADHMVHDVTWAAKYGNPEAWNDQRYLEEAEYVRENPHRETLMRAFEIGGIEYGRADYGLIGGVPQIWEINTNPSIPGGNMSKVPPQRVEATLTALENRWQALESVDTATAGAALALSSPLLERFRRRQDTSRPDLIRP